MSKNNTTSAILRFSVDCAIS